MWYLHMNEWWTRWKLLFPNETKSYVGELFRRCIAWRFKKLSREVCIKLCGPYAATLLNWTLIFEWYIARLVVKNGQQKDMGFERLDYYPQNMLKFNISRFNSEHNLEHVLSFKKKENLHFDLSYHFQRFPLGVLFIHAVLVSIHVLE